MRNSLSQRETVGAGTDCGTESKLVELGVVLAVPQSSEATFESDVVVVELQEVGESRDEAGRAL